MHGTALGRTIIVDGCSPSVKSSGAGQPVGSLTPHVPARFGIDTL